MFQPGQVDDQSILRDLAAGNLDAFDTFVDRYKDRLHRYLVSRVRDTHVAEDLAQEVFLRVFRAAKLGRAAEAVSVAPWLFTIARNCATDYYRLRLRRPPTVGLDSPAADLAQIDAQQQIIKSEQAKLAYQLLDRLPAQQSEVIRLKIFGQLSFTQIADVVGAPEPTVKSRMRYGLTKLHTYMVAQGGSHV